jgi:hypothetical protein
MGDNTVTLSTGVVLKVRPVSQFVLYANANRVRRPKVPVVYIESKDREEENPMHPDYLDAMERYEEERAEAVADALLGLGSELVDVPKGFDRPEDTGWSEQLEAIGLEVPQSGMKRYLRWVRLWAIKTPEDMVALTQRITQLTATPEEAVAEVAESFRNPKERRANLGARGKG